MLKRRVSKKRFNRKFIKGKTRRLRKRTSRKRTLRRRFRGGSAAIPVEQRCEMTKPKAGASGELIHCKKKKNPGKKYCGKHDCPHCDNVKSSIRVKCDTCCLKQCEIAGSSADINATACAGGTGAGAAAGPCGITEFNECAVCLDLNADHAIHPCGHLFCESDANYLTESDTPCPICRGKIYKTPPLKIFL